MARRPRVEVRMNPRALRQLLNSDEVRDDLTQRAERVLADARSSAPVASGEYRDGLHIVQDTTDRAVVRVAGNTDHDLLVEAATGNLARALDAAGGD